VFGIFEHYLYQYPIEWSITMDTTLHSFIRVLVQVNQICEILPEGFQYHWNTTPLQLTMETPFDSVRVIHLLYH